MTLVDIYKMVLKYLGIGAPPSEAMAAADQGAKMSKACAASGVVQTVAMAVGDLAADAYWNSHNHGGGKPVGAEGGAQVQQKAEKTELRSTPALQQKQPSESPPPLLPRQRLRRRARRQLPRRFTK